VGRITLVLLHHVTEQHPEPSLRRRSLEVGDPILVVVDEVRVLADIPSNRSASSAVLIQNLAQIALVKGGLSEIVWNLPDRLGQTAIGADRGVTWVAGVEADALGSVLPLAASEGAHELTDVLRLLLELRASRHVLQQRPRGLLSRGIRQVADEGPNVVLDEPPLHLSVQTGHLLERGTDSLIQHTDHLVPYISDPNSVRVRVLAGVAIGIVARLDLLRPLLSADKLVRLPTIVDDDLVPTLLHTGNLSQEGGQPLIETWMRVGLLDPVGGRTVRLGRTRLVGELRTVRISLIEIKPV